MTGAWRLKAACRNAPDPELFFPLPHGDASAYCGRREVTRQCLADALAQYRPGRACFGVWAGTTESERDLLRQKAGVS